MLLFIKECPKCQADTTVVDTRTNFDGVIVRKRKCQECNEVYKTYEIDANTYKQLDVSIDTTCIDTALDSLHTLEQHLITLKEAQDGRTS